MIRRSFRIGLLLGVLAGLAFALVKVLGSREQEVPVPSGGPPSPWPRLSTPDPAPAPVPIAAEPAPVMTAPVEAIVEEVAAEVAPVPPPAPVAAAAPAKKAPAKKKAPLKAWVEPADGVCPTTHPVKAKLASKIFHLPGMLNYERTKPDRCYVDAEKAEADGLRAAKR